MTKPLNNKAIEKERLDLIVAYRQTFSDKHGEKVLNDLIKRHIFRSSMHDNPHLTSFNEGERNVILLILKMLNIEENHLRERLQNVKTT